MPRMSEAEYRAFIERATKAQVTAEQYAPRRRVHREAGLQRRVCQFWALTYPQTWRVTFHPPNGLAAKNRKLAAIFRGLGVKPGVFDLICIARLSGWNGLAIELKIEGKLSEAQRTWRDYFLAEGWYASVAHTFEDVEHALWTYHNGCAPELPPLAVRDDGKRGEGSL